VIFRGKDGREKLVLLQSSKGLAVVHPKTGKIVSYYDGGASTVSSPVLNGETIFLPSHGLTALTMGPADSQLLTAWTKTDISPGMPSPVFLDGRVYSITRGPILIAADAKTGKLAWRLRLKGTFYASPIAANGKLYVVNDDGFAQVISLEPSRGTISAERDFKESIMGTPALSDGALYFRSEAHVWKIGN
jgi:outer membrane protein assembly factor BamB